MADGTVTIGWNNSALESGVARAKSIVTGFQNTAKSALGGLGVGQFLGISGAILGIKMLGDHMSHLADVSARLDTTAESVQRLGLMAKTSGTDVESAGRALLKLERSLYSVDDEKAVTALKNLGITAEGFSNLEADQKMIAIAVAFQEAEKSGKGFADIYELIGKNAGEILPIIRSDIDAMREMASTSVVSGEQVKMIDDLGDSLEVTKAQFVGFISAAAGFARQGITALFSGDVSASWQKQNEERMSRIAAKEEELANRKKARIEEIKRLEAEAAAKRDEETQKRLEAEAALARKQAENVRSIEARTEIAELKAHGRTSAAQKLEKSNDLQENIAKLREQHPEKGEDWARQMALRQAAAQDKLEHPGRIHGYVPPAARYKSALDAMNAKGALKNEFKFPQLDEMVKQLGTITQLWERVLN